jgi:16S rRNA (guanine966-N2)-methyltransferase
MKILAGEFGGRTITRPKTSSVRPMSDKVRAALFNILGDVRELRVLDIYAGSGAVGLEAVSRGAAEVVLVEGSRSVAVHINKTIKDLGVASAQTIIEKAEVWVKRADGEFDLIVADPPYEKIEAATLDAIAAHLDQEGTFVVSHSSRIAPPALESVSLVDSRTYGDSALSFYKK